MTHLRVKNPGIGEIDKFVNEQAQDQFPKENVTAPHPFFVKEPPQCLEYLTVTWIDGKTRIRGTPRDLGLFAELVTKLSSAGLVLELPNENQTIRVNWTDQMVMVIIGVQEEKPQQWRGRSTEEITYQVSIVKREK